MTFKDDVDLAKKFAQWERDCNKLRVGIARLGIAQLEKLEHLATRAT